MRWALTQGRLLHEMGSYTRWALHEVGPTYLYQLENSFKNVKNEQRYCLAYSILHLQLSKFVTNTSSKQKPMEDRRGRDVQEAATEDNKTSTRRLRLKTIRCPPGGCD